MRLTAALSRALQQVGLVTLLLLLPASSAAVEISFFLLLFGWIGERLAMGWLSMEPGPGGSRGAVGVLRAAWRTSVWSQEPQSACLVALAAYVGWCGMTILSSVSPQHSLNGWISKTTEYALFVVLAADAMRAPGASRRAFWVLMASAGLVAVDGVAQELTGRDFLRGRELGVYVRMTGPYQNPGDLACYFMVVLPVALTGIARMRSWARGALIGLTALLLGCFVRVESQGAWLGFLAGLVVVGACIRRWRAPMAVAGLLFLAAGAWWLHHEGRLASVASLSDVGTRDRMAVWEAGWRMVEDRPVTGQGLNTFMARYLDFWVGGERQPRYAHNCYLQVAAETGLVGLALFLVLLVALFGRIGEGIRHAPPDGRLLLAGLAAGLAAFALQAAMDTNFYSLRQASLFWVLTGAGIGLSAQASAARRVVEERVAPQIAMPGLSQPTAT